MKIFLSAVSAQFEAARHALASDLRAIGCEVKVQEDFQQSGGDLIGKLEAYVAGCDRVIAVIGDAFGFEAAGVAVPGGGPARSYSQWEYFFARGERLDGSRANAKDIFVYTASEKFAAAPEQSPEHAERQRHFRREVEASLKDRNTFDSVDQLCRLVLRHGWQMQARPRRPRNLPFASLGPLFKGREGFMRDLHDRLEQRRTRAAAIVSKQAIHGLGGVGKTRLAIEYALRHQAEYSALLFVGGATPQGLRSNLAALCARDVLDLPEQEAREEEARYEAALRWLRDYSGWLLIIDNADTPEAARAVEALARSLGDGHVLVTARVSSWSAGVEALELDVLADEDAVAFLLERTDGRRETRPTDAANALALARDMGGLAVALEQAGAYVGELRLSLEEYLRRWQAGDVEVRGWNEEALTQYPREALVTWNVTIEMLDGPARELLELLSFFAPEPIPRFVLDTDAAREVLGADPSKALAGLTRFSLVRWEEGNHAFRIHRLVQEVTRARLPPAAGHARQEGALAVLNAAVPADPSPSDVRSWAVWDPLLPHVTSMVAAADRAGIAAPTARLMTGLGLLLQTRSALQEAEPLMRRALALAEGSFGADHPEVAIDLNNLALLLQETNRFVEAEPLTRRALAIGERALGAEHPIVATRLNNLAQLLHNTNRLVEAEPLMRRALAIDEGSFGANHPRVAIDLNNLARLLHDTNRLVEAEPLMRRALAIDDGSFGAEHPWVARDLNNLATLLQDTNRLAEAEPLMRRALAIDERFFGAHHPKVGIHLNNLARLLKATNRLADAESLMRRSLEILLRSTATTGHPHPRLHLAANNHRALLAARGRTSTEADAEIEALARSYGVDL